MQNRLYLISWFALIVSVSFFVVGVLNSDWVRMEKGYYIMVILWAGFSIFLRLNFLLTVKMVSRPAQLI